MKEETIAKYTKKVLPIQGKHCQFQQGSSKYNLSSKFGATRVFFPSSRNDEITSTTVRHPLYEIIDADKTIN